MSNTNFDDFSRRPENFGKDKENTDRIVFPDEFEKISLNEVNNGVEDKENKNDENVDDRIVFPDDEVLNKENKRTVSGNGNFEDYIRDPVNFGTNTETNENGVEDKEEKNNKGVDDRIVFPDDELLNKEDKRTTNGNGNFEDYIRDPVNFGTNKETNENVEIGEITFGAGENFDDYIRQPENFGNGKDNGEDAKEEGS